MPLLIFDALLLLLCGWIVVPPLNGATLAARVVAIELSPYLLVLNLIAFAFAFRLRARARLAALALTAANLALCAIPVVAQLRAPALTQAIVAQPDPVQAQVVEFAIPVDLGNEHTSIHAYLPTTSGLRPIVFAVYGGAWRWGTPNNDAVLNRTLASQGYAVFALDYRHSPQYRFPLPLDDVRAEVALIVSKAPVFRADPSRMAIIGHSSGGQMAELLAFAPHSPFRALISYSGAVDLVKGYEFPPQPDPIGVRSIIVSYMGDTPARIPDRYKAASPIDNVRCSAPPTLLIYGDGDHVVDFRSALKLRDALKACGTDVTLLELPWTEHGFEDIPFGMHSQVALASVEAFLRRTLR
jgi:acetyl esterase/lipase